MKPRPGSALTTTTLLTQFRCAFARHVRYAAKKPLAMNHSRRRFGSIVHHALELYEKAGRKLEPILKALRSARGSMDPAQLAEAEAMLRWNHERTEGKGGTALLIERRLEIPLGNTKLVVQVDRLDAVPGGHLLVEYKTGRRIQFEDVSAQLIIQSYAIWRATGAVPTAWQIDLLASREILTPPPVRDPAVLEAFTWDLADQVLRDEKEPKPRMESFCRGCEARAYCPKVSKRPKPLSEPKAVKHAPRPEAASLWK